MLKVFVKDFQCVGWAHLVLVGVHKVVFLGTDRV